MMIIDADVHISPFQEPGRISIDDLLRIMDRAEVNKAIVWLQPHYLRDVEVGNRYIFEATRRHPDRILGFGWADPHFGIEKAIETVQKCIEEYNFYGVKLNGAQNEFYIDDERISLPIIEAIVRTGKLLAFHIGTDAYEATHPFRLGKIAQRYPNTKILAVHMGGVAHNDLTNAMIEIAQQNPNLVLIGSAVKSRAILKAIRNLGADRVCFGSDTPFELMHVEVARYRALLEGEVSDQEMNYVLGGNIVRLIS
jgi:predicted TIM-barrel fold metal-dependent hydrolase